MMLPTLHMNGTPRTHLEDALSEAGGAIITALTTLGAAGPNGRDYYPQGPDAIGAAVREHESRMQRLRGVLEELQAIHEHVSLSA